MRRGRSRSTSMELNVGEVNLGDYLRSQSLEAEETSSVEDFNYVYAKDDKDLICVDRDGIEKISCSSVLQNDNLDGDDKISSERLDSLNCDNLNRDSLNCENLNCDNHSVNRNGNGNGGTIAINVTSSEIEENRENLNNKSENTDCDSARFVCLNEALFLYRSFAMFWFLILKCDFLFQHFKCFRLVKDSKSLLTSLNAQLVSLKEGKSAETILLEVEDIEKNIHLHLVKKTWAS